MSLSMDSNRHRGKEHRIEEGGIEAPLAILSTGNKQRARSKIEQISLKHDQSMFQPNPTTLFGNTAASQVMGA